jgi:hypothetical protein
MKAILEFELNDHDDEMAHRRCVKALDMAIVLWDITYNVRKECERESDARDMTAYEMLELVFEKYNQLLDDNNIHPDALIE